MRQVAKKGLLTAVGTASVLASTAGYAYASAEAQGVTANSPGVGSGNSVQVPVDAPINACGNTVDVVGLLNPAMGNSCGNTSAHTRSGGASAGGGAHGSPGVASGNSVQVPITAPVNACGNSVDVVGAGNPAFGNSCGNGSAHTPQPPAGSGDEACPPGGHTPAPGGDTPPPSPQPGGSTRGGSGNGDQTPPATGGSGVTGVSDKAPAAVIPSQSTPVLAPAASGQLAHTGATGLELLAPAGVALLLAGGVLYRRSRVGAGAR